MKDAAKTILRASLAPESLILGAATCNFIVVWMASAAPCMGFICPWYQPWRFTNEPTRLLVAACLLRTGRAWGYSAAIALCGFMLVEGTGYAEDYARGVLLESLRWVWDGMHLLSPHGQYFLAGVILMYAAACWGRSAVRRGASVL